VIARRKNCKSVEKMQRRKNYAGEKVRTRKMENRKKSVRGQFEKRRSVLLSRYRFIFFTTEDKEKRKKKKEPV